MVFNCEIVIEDIVLETEANIFPDFFKVVAVVHAQDIDLALVRFEQSSEEVDGGRFSGPIMSQKAKYFGGVKFHF